MKKRGLRNKKTRTSQCRPGNSISVVLLLIAGLWKAGVIVIVIARHADPQAGDDVADRGGHEAHAPIVLDKPGVRKRCLTAATACRPLRS